VAEATASATPSAGYCGSATISIDYAPYTTATLARYGWEFVVVDVVGFEPGTFNTPDGKAPAGFPKASGARDPNLVIYTPIDVQIDQAISGAWNLGRGQFLVEGGIVGCFTMSVYGTPKVEIGARYVFIVSDAPDASGRVLPLPNVVFAWPVDPNGIVTTVDGLMSLDDLEKLVTQGTRPSGA
jgi:hypothetical protein